VTPELVGRLARAAGLDLTPERREALVPLLEEFLAGAARLEEVDVLRWEPSVGFDPPATRRAGR
jgi:Asp-tRNA(Asn)/Glu-tRNA(Gln) amidotransferase C subunit